uniref:Large ribosomal subunit protein uL3m n=2 Tax=Cacopsylla melanoneura TaxID=428564 RepID=A0A8D8THE4_9HEMI
MALNHNLRLALSNCHTLLSKRINVFESPFLFGCSEVMSIRQKKVWIRPPRVKYPIWFLQQERADYDEKMTRDNRAFLEEVVHDKYGQPAIKSGLLTYDSPLKMEPIEPREMTKASRRTGLIGKIIGQYPLWWKNGEKVRTTLVQIPDNHVIKYIPPQDFNPPRQMFLGENRRRRGCLLVGAESGDPSLYTKEYCGLFKNSGVPPKKRLSRFIITPDAMLPPGTPLTALHFRPREFLDVKGLTVDQGFQGVMKRWGFKGLPATHGVTKSHRRGGCIGGGAGKARVYPGKKMPGHMGNRWRMARGVEILRINTKYNVLFLKGTAIPGSVGSWVYLYDSLLPTKIKQKAKKDIPPPHFPTYIEDEDSAPEDLYHPDLHVPNEPSIKLEKDK